MHPRTMNSDKQAAENHEISLMPADYRERTRPEQARKHLNLIEKHPGYPQKNFLRNPVTWELQHGAISHHLATFTLNNPHALAYVTAAVSQCRASIQTAQLFPRSDGSIIIEVDFTLSARGGLDDLAEHLEMYFSPDLHARPQPPCEALGELQVRAWRTPGSRQGTVEIVADDRRGLLYRIAETFAMHGIKIVEAEITTQGGRVRDLFHVTDRLGRPLDLNSDTRRLEREIREDFKVTAS